MGTYPHVGSWVASKGESKLSKSILYSLLLDCGHNAANNSPTTPPALLGRRYPQELWPKLTLPPLSCFWQGFCHSNETSNYSRTQYSADSDVGAALGHDPSSSHWCFVMGSLCEHLWGQVSLLSPSLHTAMRPHDCDWLTMS